MKPLFILWHKIKPLFFDNRILTGIYIFTLFLIRLPPLMLPYLSFITSSLIIKLLLLILLIACLLKATDKYYLKLLNRPFIILTLLYFLSRCLSVVVAFDPISYIVGFQRFFFGFITVFIIALISVSKKYLNKLIKHFMLVLFITALLNSLIILGIYFASHSIIPLISIFIRNSTITIIESNLERDRLFLNFLDELAIPIALYYLFSQYTNLKNRLINLSGFFLIVFSSYISNWRIRIVNALIAIFATGYFIKELSIWKKKIFLFGLLLALGVVLWTYNISTNYSIIDRFNFFDLEEIGSTQTRLSLWEKAISIGLIPPYIGGGFDSFPFYFTKETSLIRPSTRISSNSLDFLSKLTYQSPHNIFFTNLAEGGLFSFFFFCILVFYFLYKDFFSKTSFFRLKKPYITILSIQFWLLIVYAMFHPTDSLEFYFIFFTLRALLEFA